MSDSTSDRDPLDSLAEEFLARYRAGERPSIAEFAQRLPGREDEVREFLPALVEMEELKPISGEMTGDYRVPHPETAHPSRVGDYRILRLVGRGGMGAVYEAVQESLGRHVALKLLPTDSFADPARLERFRREARSAAQLHHTNIVPVFGVGEDNGRHFYAMQFISGHPLDEVIEEVQRLKERTFVGTQRAVSEVAVALLTGTMANPRVDQPNTILTERDQSHQMNGSSSGSNPALSGSLSDGGRHYWRTIARLGWQVADALSYAHAQGVLHRDIKPANLLLDLQGTVWVADFGLAKSNDSDNLTQTGDIVGTLRYLAPERFDGAGDHGADIYAIGLTLYELLTLRPAFQANTRAKLVEQAVAANPPRPRSIDPTIPRDLETVILKAIARDPAMRYQSAAALADDLRRYMEDRPVRARRATPSEQFVRWCRRNPAVAALLATVLFVTTAGAGVASFFAARASDRADEANRERAKAFVREQEAQAARGQAETMAEEARKRLVRLNVLNGTTYQDAGNPASALLWFHHAWEQDHADPKADAAHRVRIAGTLAEMPALIGACFHDASVCDAVFSPDARTILTRTVGEKAYHWDYEKSTLIAPPLVHSARIRHVCFSPDGKSVATASADGTACVWDAANGAKRFTLKHDGPLTWVAFHPDGKRIATSAEDKTVRMWSASDGKPRDWRLPIEAVVDHLAFSPDGSRMVTSSRDNFARVWEVESRKAVSPPLPHHAMSDTARYEFNGDDWPRFAPEGPAAISYTPDLHVWPGDPADAVRTIKLELISEVCFIPGTDRALVCGPNRVARVIGLKDGKIVQSLMHPRNANNGTVSPDGKWLLTASTGGLATLWDASNGQSIGDSIRCGDHTSALAFSPDSSRYLVASQDGTVRVWSTVPPARDIHPWLRDCGRANRWKETLPSSWRVYSPDAKRVVEWAKDQTKASVVSNHQPPRFIEHSEPIDSIFFCDDGSHIVVAGADSVSAWKAETVERAGPVIRTNKVSVARDAGRLRPNHLSRDGTRLLAWDDERSLSVWELTTGRRLFGPAGQPDPGPVLFGEPGLAGHVSAAVLSPDGLQIAVAINTSGTLTVWDVETGKVLHHNRRYRGFVAGLEFSGDGHRILLYSTDTIVRTIDAATGNPLGPAVRQTTGIGGLSPVGVSPDGGKMVIHDQVPQALRVIDVDRGERLLTLPIDKETVPFILWFNDKVSSVNFLSGTGAFTVPLPHFDLPLDDAEPLLQFLTGQQIDETDGIEFVDQFTFKKDPERYRRVFERWKHPQTEAK
jgi:WD40 repeat protein/serine/threonine protein kinase